MDKKPIDILLDQVDWEAVPIDSNTEHTLPHVTHQGIFKILDLEIECVQLNTGQRLITEKGMESFYKFLNGENS